MAQIAPFRGICFNPAEVADLERVVSPPYDVIDSALQNCLLKRSPYNIVRLILGESAEGESSQSRYQRSAELFKQWQQQQILQRDEQPAIYLYDQEYERLGHRVTRKGFIALTRIEEFSSGMVKPHELTRFDWCRDRLQLLRHCQANFSPVFSLYSDPCCVVEAISSSVRKTSPALMVEDDLSVVHRLWRIQDHRLIATIQDVLSRKPLLIADGHHRYETALNYRDEQRDRRGDFSGKETFNYIAMYFSNMEAPACQSVPQHRLLSYMSTELFLHKASEHFSVSEVNNYGSSDDMGHFDHWNAEEYVLYLYDGSRTVYAMKLHDEAEAAQRYRQRLACVPATTHQALISRAVLDDVLNGMSATQRIVHSAEMLRTVVDREEAHAGILIPALDISLVKDIANSGAKIPDNSTCFYPSVLSGLIINPIVDDEQIGDFL